MSTGLFGLADVQAPWCPIYVAPAGAESLMAMLAAQEPVCRDCGTRKLGRERCAQGVDERGTFVLCDECAALDRAAVGATVAVSYWGVRVPVVELPARREAQAERRASCLRAVNHD